MRAPSPPILPRADRLLERAAADGQSLIHDSERAPLVRRAFEDYATGQYAKEQLLKWARAWGLTNRRAKPLTAQAIGVLLRNQLFAGIVDVPEYGVRGKRGEFEPLVSEEVGLPRPSDSARPVRRRPAPVDGLTLCTPT